MDEEEYAEALTYRIAYSHAWRAIDRDRIGSNAPGRDPLKQLATLEAFVLREMGGTDAAGRHVDAIREGVHDAAEGRRPRW